MSGRLHDRLEHWARTRPDDECALDGQRTVSWRAAAEATDRTAAALVGLGLEPGARAAVLAGNSIDYLLLYYAASKAGVVLVPLNPRAAAPEWAHVVTDAGATVVIADTAHVPALDALGDRLSGVRHVVPLDGLAAEVPVGGVDRAGPDDDVYQLYTSGTTGRPKGAVLTHRAVTANCAQIAAMPHRGLPGERSLVAAPLCHAGVVWTALAPHSWGAAAYVLPRVDPAEVVRVLDEERIGYAALVPAILRMLLDVPDVARRPYQRLRLIHTGSAPIAETTLRATIAVFGCDVVVGYGMTEACAGTSAMTPDDTRRGLTDRPDLLRGVGRPLPGTEVRVVDRSGAVLGAGEVGEICVRGPQLMRGYWGLAAATGEALREGWLHTGDVGWLDTAGRLSLCDRLTDVIVTGGVNVYPAAVEQVLHAHPAVAEAAVIGVPDERWGETVAAVVVPRAGADLTEAGVTAFCRDRLGGPQRPRVVRFAASLPRTSSGKVRKRELRAPFWAGRDREVAGA
jgi:acyl-CoA synthetase (AMP-forming)/AMP-acid ligase II